MQISPRRLRARCPAGRRAVAALAVLVGLGLSAGPAAAETDGDAISVVRLRILIGDRSYGAGTAFFVHVPAESHVVALSSAHAVGPERLAEADQAAFWLGGRARRVSHSRRLYAKPGRAFTDAFGSLRDDFLVFAPESPPEGVKVLDLDFEPLGEGERVRILGVPVTPRTDQDQRVGAVTAVDGKRIEIALESGGSLTGWDGGPVLRESTGQVVGILQTGWVEDGELRAAAAPIDAVLDALAVPLEGGLGMPFASLSGAETKPSVAAGPLSTQRDDSAAPEAGAGVFDTEVVVGIEFPPDHAVVNEPTGAFLSGDAFALLRESHPRDVVFLLDTSRSTNQMSGTDVDGDGLVGQDVVRGRRGSSDPGDSILAAEVAAVRKLLDGLDPRHTRVALVTFAGEPRRSGPSFFKGNARASAITQQPLTADYESLEGALDRVLRRRGEGMTNLAAGIEHATAELVGLPGSLSETNPISEKIVVLLTDAQPSQPRDPVLQDENLDAAVEAASRAELWGVRIHTFALGPEGAARPLAAVEVADRTHGEFNRVRVAGDLADVVKTLVQRADLQEVSVRNVSSGEAASEVAASPGGAWSALVPVRSGSNQIEVIGRAGDGTEGRAVVTVEFEPSAPGDPLPVPLAAERDRLLEQRLSTLQNERMRAEKERAEKKRRELELEIARQRAWRKELELQVGRPQQLGATPTTAAAPGRDTATDAPSTP